MENEWAEGESNAHARIEILAGFAKVCSVHPRFLV